MISSSGIQVDNPLAQNAAGCEPVQAETVLKTQCQAFLMKYFNKLIIVAVHSHVIL